MKKLARTVSLLLLAATFVTAQSLVDLAKKEKERRESLRGKRARIITNADLAAAKRTPAVDAGPAGGIVPNEDAVAEPADASEPEQAYPRVRFGPGGGEPDTGGFARSSMEGTALVENPGFALQYPDGRYAEIALQGVLELDFIARNGPGDDIAIFARRSGSKDGRSIEDGLPASDLELLGLPGTFFYGVVVLTDQGEWLELGTGSGLSSPDRFDLGDINRISAVRIVFVMPHGIQNQGEKQLGQITADFTMGIDAVQALH